MAVLARGLIIDDYKKGASNLILCITKNQVQNVRRRRILAGNVALRPVTSVGLGAVRRRWV